MPEILVQPPSESLPVPSASRPGLDGLSSTPGGSHFLSSTPGGTRIWYTRDQLLALQGSSPGRFPTSSSHDHVSTSRSSEADSTTVVTRSPSGQGQTGDFGTDRQIEVRTGAGEDETRLGVPTVEGSGIGLNTNFATPTASPKASAVRQANSTDESGQFDMEL